MNLSNEQVQIILDDFVVDNAEDINEVQNTNPVLYDAVIDALNYISKKFGTQDKLEIPETIRKVEEVVEIPTKEQEKKQSPLVVGDIFRGTGPFFEVILVKDDIIYFNKLDDSTPTQSVSIERAELSLSDGSWKKVRRPKRGDVFKSSIGKEYIIRNISTSNIDIEIAWYENNGIKSTSFKIWNMLDNYEDGTFTLVSEGNDVNEFIENQKNNLNPQSNVQQAKVYSFKEGDDFYYALNPSIVYKIDKINANGDIDTSTKGGTEWTLDAEALEEEIQDGTVIIGLPIIVQSSQTSSKLTLQEQINELKDSIDAFKLLADLGDTDAIDEVKKLKKELKDLKSTNK
jgi:hypothetical protein